MTDKEVMKLALFALDIVKIHYTQNRHINEAITALKDRLADPMREVQRLGQEIEQEPVDFEKLAALGWQAIECKICGGGAMGYPQRPWVDLTDEEHHEIVLFAESGDWHDFEVINATEAKLREKNT
jgi:hypothetical protein